MGRSFKILRFLALVIFFQSCSRKVSEFKIKESMDRVQIKRTYRGVLQWTLKGEKLVKGRKISASAVSGVFYEDGREKYFFKSDRAVFPEKGKDFELSGNVCISEKENNTQIYLEDLKWDEARQVYFTDKKVRQVSDGTVITGDGFTATEDLNHIEIKNPKVTALSIVE